MDENQNTGVTASPADTATQVAPTGSETVTNTGATEEQTVPFTRFQEVNNGLKEEREARKQMEERLETLQEQINGNNQKTNPDEIDPEVEKLLESYASKKGFVSKEQLDEAQKQADLKIQIQQDIQDLKGQYKDFDYLKVRDYAQENGMSINSKADMRAIYKDMNYETILENERKKAIAEYQESGRSTAETNGSTVPNSQEQKQAPSLKGRISSARQKLGV